MPLFNGLHDEGVVIKATRRTSKIACTSKFVRDITKAVDMARETVEVNCLGTLDKYSRDEIIQAITKEQK